MSDLEKRFHETWLGLVQPVEGLVVSVPVLVDAQCIERQPTEAQAKLLALCPPTRQSDAGPVGRALVDPMALFTEVLGFSPDNFDPESALPDELALYVPEGKQTLRPTYALKKPGPLEPPTPSADSTPASLAGARYEMLVWALPTGLALDKPETITGSWSYPPAAKFDRLLRHCRVPIGLLLNGEALRLIYAPAGGSSGAITFRFDDMASVGGRPILDALVMLLSANRFFGVAPDRALPALLAESRKRQANVTNQLAEQVFEAQQLLLRGFEAAAERDGRDLLDDALAREHDHLYKGLLTVLLRLVFVLYAEDLGLLPVEHPLYAQNLSVLGLFEQLQRDHGAHPDSMARRFGAWGRLLALFRAVYLGVEHGDFRLPPRRGSLFDPHRYAFLEGWGPAGSAPINNPEAQADLRVPTLDDETVYRILGRLLILDGQRLSYKTLDVEQLGSVYEALMGYHVVRVPAEAVCLRPDGVWLTLGEALEAPAARRAKWLKEAVGLSNAHAEKLAHDLASAPDPAAQLEALAKFAVGGRRADPALARARPGQLVLQPGSERRRTSSHYTPRELTQPIVRRTLEPLLAVMGEAPPADRILSLKICDPAMGSGAFLVEACRFLATYVVAAWTRENALEAITHVYGDPERHALRLVAQRCLYGVDKNDAAVELAKLSLWLVTLAKDLPFTFLDHALRWGDSLVGLNFDQIRSFHWKPGTQLGLFTREVDQALSEAVDLRQQILDLASRSHLGVEQHKALLLEDARDALDRVRLIGDLIVGAFFAYEKDKDREKERLRRLELVRAWLESDEPPSAELKAMQAEIRECLPVFHWMVEFPEVFFAERPDPLDDGKTNGAAFMDAFVGNPPFAGKNSIADSSGAKYVEWLMGQHSTFGNTDLCAYFFRAADRLIGDHGALGFVATNTISQGDTRENSLQHLVSSKRLIFAADPNQEWPGSASVRVSIVHICAGNVSKAISGKSLSGKNVAWINSRLEPQEERPAPVALGSNRGLSYMGVKMLGQGFVLTNEQARELISKDRRNGQIIKPFVSGEDVNQSPDGYPARQVIYFGTMSLEEAAQWPELLRVAEERVRPEREQNNRATYRTYWWRPGETGGALYNSIRDLRRCLVTSIVSKHLIFSIRPTDLIFSSKVYVFPLETMSSFCALQSRVHEPWARLLSSTMKSDLSYSASDCFETFPFPQPDPRTVIPELEDIGQRLYDFRAKYMVDENVGLTITYNRLKDPTCHEPRIVELRCLHEEMDRAVLAAYGWGDLEVPPYCPASEADKKKLELFESAVIDKLFARNAQRAEEERLKGLAAGPKQKGSGKRGVAKQGKAATAGVVVEQGELGLGVVAAQAPTSSLAEAGAEDRTPGPNTAGGSVVAQGIPEPKQDTASSSSVGALVEGTLREGKFSPEGLATKLNVSLVHLQALRDSDVLFERSNLSVTARALLGHLGELKVTQIRRALNELSAITRDDTGAEATPVLLAARRRPDDEKQLSHRQGRRRGRAVARHRASGRCVAAVAFSAADRRNLAHCWGPSERFRSPPGFVEQSARCASPAR